MIRAAVLVTILGLSGFKTMAQQRFDSLEELWKHVNDHNIQINMSRTQKEIAEAALRQTQSNFLPTLNLNGSFTDNISIQPTLVPAELFGGQPGTFAEEQFGRRYTYNAGLSAQIDLMSTNNWFALKGARFDKSASELNWTFNRKNIYSATANAYFTYYMMYESAKLSLESLKTAEAIQLHTNNLFVEGQISIVTLNTVNIQVKAARLSLLASRQSQQSALNQLKQLLEMEVTDSLVLPEELPEDLSSDWNASQDLSEDVSVNLSRMQMMSAKNSWQASRAAYAPSLSAVYAYNLQIMGDNFLSFGGTNSLPQQYWGLRLTLPLLAHGTRTLQNQKSHLEFKSSTSRYESAQRQAALSDDNLINNYQTSKAKLLTSQSILKLYHENDVHAARQLEAGQISLDDRLRVNQDYTAYKSEYLLNLSEFFMRHAELKVRQQSL